MSAKSVEKLFKQNTSISSGLLLLTSMTKLKWDLAETSQQL
jgi:hypothetical protein